MPDTYLHRDRDLWYVASSVSDTYLHRDRDLPQSAYLTHTSIETETCGSQIRWLRQASVSVEVCVRYTGCQVYPSLCMYVSDIMGATGFCLYGGMCQLRWLPQATGLCLCGGMCQIRWAPTETVSNSKAGWRQFHKLYKYMLRW